MKHICLSILKIKILKAYYTHQDRSLKKSKDQPNIKNSPYEKQLISSKCIRNKTLVFQLLTLLYFIIRQTKNLRNGYQQIQLSSKYKTIPYWIHPPCVFLPEKHNKPTVPKGVGEEVNNCKWAAWNYCSGVRYEVKTYKINCIPMFSVSHKQCIKKQGLGDSTFFQLLTIIFSKRMPHSWAVFSTNSFKVFSS